MKKFSLILLILLGLVFLGFRALQPALIEGGFNRLVKANVGVDPAASLEDGLHVYICGAGSPLPDPKRSGPCIGVIAGQQAYVFDAGTGGSRNLGPMGFPLARLEAIFLTHLHSDHIDGLGEMLLGSWINGGRTTPTPVYGPVGTSEIVDGFNQAYRIDSTYRTAHHGNRIAPPNGFGGQAQEIDFAGKSHILFDDGEIRITVFAVSHEPVSPAFGYRIDYKDRSVVISGDTAYDPTVIAASKGVDVLFHEALNPDMVEIMAQGAAANGNLRLAKIFRDIPDYHTTPVDAARIAQKAEVKDLVLYHIVPMLPRDALIPLFTKGMRAAFDGKITVSEDGLIVRLPTGCTDIVYENAL